MPTLLEDKEYGVITTDFAVADQDRLHMIALNAAAMSKGRFTMKIAIKEKSRFLTTLSMTLQIRQRKMWSKKERLLKSNGVFEKFLAYRVYKQALSKQFPALEEILLGMNIIPDCQLEQYRIANVDPNSPAEEAGLQPGDWIMAIDGKNVTIRGELFDFLLTGEQEEKHVFRVSRDSQFLELPVWVLRIPKDQPKLGLFLNWDVQAHQFVVKDVVEHSQAAQAGFKPGDRIMMEGEIAVDSWTNYYRAVARSHKGAPVTFKVLRDTRLVELTAYP